MPSILQADLTLVDGRLESGVVVHVGRDGTITRVRREEPGAGPLGSHLVPQHVSVGDSQPGEFGSPRARRKQRLRGRILVPGFVNSHSHAFQRLLRGRTEHRRAGEEPGDFWSWRGAMYRVTEALTPEDVEAVSAFCFMEMLRAGYTHVAEFHYVHNQPGGRPYADPAELSRRVLAGAEFAGIGITLLRVAYQRGGAGSPASHEQSRFVDESLESYERALDATQAHASSEGPRASQVGIAAHSVRALDSDWLRGLGRMSSSRGLITHAHVSEQPREVEECLAEHGRRPVEQLAESGLLSSRFTAVHATHLAPSEAELLGQAEAAACICPTTERNLGDGLPDLRALTGAGVSLAVGSDSQVRVDPFAELRALEDGERLRTGERVVLGDEGGQVAPVLFAAGTRGGEQTTGLQLGRIEEGYRGDLVALEMNDPAVAGVLAGRDSAPAVLAALALGGHPRMVRDVWVGGRKIVNDGVLLRWDAALEAYSRVVSRIWS